MSAVGKPPMASEADDACARKLRLLEARLNPACVAASPAASPTQTPTSSAPGSASASRSSFGASPLVLRTPVPPPSAPAPGCDGDRAEDVVGSFSTDDEPGSGVPAQQAAGSFSRDRSYPPAPGQVVIVEGTVEAPQKSIDSRDTPVTPLKAPGAPLKRYPRRKRGRAAATSPSSGNPTKLSRMDDYFKPSTSVKGKSSVRAGSDSLTDFAEASDTPSDRPESRSRLGDAPSSVSLRSPAVTSGKSTSHVRRELAFQSVPPSPATPGPNTRPLDVRPGDAYAHMRTLIDELQAQVDSLTEELVTVKKDYNTVLVENEDLRAQVEEIPGMQTKAADLQAQLDAALSRNRRMCLSLREALIQGATHQRSDKRQKSAALADRLGRIVTERNGTSFTEVWEDGYAFRDIAERLHNIQDSRERLEKQRKELAKLKKSMPPPATPGAAYEGSAEYACEQDEILKLRAMTLKREEDQNVREREKMLMERDCHLREISRQRDEAASLFGKFPMLKDRYLLLNLLGRGGFSEVFHAYDFESAQFVACKVHQLSSNWSEQRKQSFLRHMLREHQIHQSLSHPRILRAWDSFELDNLTVVSVLELCQGFDLDALLRKNGSIPEREARSIIAQIFSGLVYLDENVIVHYDLKPGNILLDNGQVRITDFGLSKIMSHGEPDGMMELTSQGAGTMWYLPPECFASKGPGNAGPRISTKVDVWSAGVILYQMLFGGKPFGHGQTQEQFYRENTCAREMLQFPPRPGVSENAKEFIRLCLTRNVADRPDVRTAARHPFLAESRK